MAFLFRLTIAVLWICLFAIIAYALLALFNRGVQFLARQMGYEVKNFFQFVGLLFPKKRKKRKIKTPPTIR